MNTSRRAFLAGAAACAVVAPAGLRWQPAMDATVRGEHLALDDARMRFLELTESLQRWQVQLRELILAFESGVDKYGEPTWSRTIGYGSA